MFKIKNIRGGKIILGDLGITLKDGQEVDLDLRYPREVAERSIHLRRAIEHDLVSVLEKDSTLDRRIVDEMEARIRSQIAQLQQPQPLAASQPNGDVQQLSNKLDALINAIQKGAFSGRPSADDEIDLAIDADKQVDIISRSYERMRRGTEGHVESQKKKTKSSDVTKRADELGDFL